MGKSWAAAALVLVALGPAAVRAADPGFRLASRQPDPSSVETLPAPKTDSGGLTLPAPESVAPTSTAPSLNGAFPVAAGPGDCAACAGEGPPHQHFACLRKLISWATYCPLKKGVNCETCKNCGYGECCCYHCFPPLWMFFQEPCVHRPVPPPCYNSCGAGPPRAKDTPPGATGADNPKIDLPTTTEGTAPTPAGPTTTEQTSFYGNTRMFSLCNGFGCSSVGSR